MAKRTFGLQSIEISDLTNDGDVGSSWSTIGDTVSDTAQLTSTDPTFQDFKTEEADNPIESIVTDPGSKTFAWSSYDVSALQLAALYGGTRTGGTSGVVGTFGSITGGSSYTNGTYTNVALTGGTGSGARATIVVSGGAVTSVTKTAGGTGYAVSDSLSALAANIGGTGTGFSVPVATISSTGEKWEASDTLPLIYKSVRITDKRGVVVVIPRAQISAKLGLSFKKTGLGQLDMTAKVLQPEKDGVKNMTITYP